MITLASIHIGRWFCIDEYFRSIEELDYDKKDIKLLWIDNSLDRKFTHMLKDYIATHKKEYKACEIIKSSYPHVPPRMVMQDRGKWFSIKMKSVAYNENLMRPHIEGDLFMHEDDMTIPPYALKRLREIVTSDPAIYAATGVCSFWGQSIWRDKCGVYELVQGKRIFPEGDACGEVGPGTLVSMSVKLKGIEPVDACGTYCLYVKWPKIGNFIFSHNAYGHLGSDINFTTYITQIFKKKILVDWSVKCVTYLEDLNGIIHIIGWKNWKEV